MIYFVFDLDDCLIMHHNLPIRYNSIRRDQQLSDLFENIQYPKYIYTNGTYGHADVILKQMDLSHLFIKIYSRDTLDTPKPDMQSCIDVHNDIINIFDEGLSPTIYFFDDQRINLKTAKQLGWTTFWIHPEYNKKNTYEYIDYSFPTLKEALFYLQSVHARYNFA